MAKAKKKAPTKAVSLIATASAKSPDDPEGRKRWPTLIELLCPIWEGAECRRQSGRLAISLTGPYYHVQLSCPTEGLQCSHMGASLDTLLDEFESKIRDGSVVWLDDWKKQKATRRVTLEAVDS